MPYEWSESTSAEGPVVRLMAWPFRSLPRRGFAAFIAATAVLITLPLFAVLGTPVLWGLLPFLCLAVGGVWWGIERSYRDAELCEELELTREELRLVRRNPRGPEQHFRANPHWIRVETHKAGGPVEDYLTLTGAGRTVELGAFLAPEERQSLSVELQDRLRALR